MIGEIVEHDSIQHPCPYQDEDFSVYVEDSTVGWILHCYVNNWTKSVYEKMLKVLVVIQENAPRKELYAFSNNDKLTKFCHLFGMEVIDEVYTKEGDFKGELLCLNQ